MKSHGHASNGRLTPTYMSFRKMRERVLNPNYIQFHLYGGRGIKICHRWAEFANFLADMGERPAGMSLDRIDTDGDYTPSNCKWSTPREQMRNKRNNKVLTLDGRSMIAADWAREIGIDQHNLNKRLARWGLRDALTRPAKSDRRHKIRQERENNQC